VAIAIRDLHALHPKKRVFVIDTDAHQGNGNNAIFAHDDRVFTYSIHVGPNYPAEKIPGSLDIALPRFVDGGRFLDELFATFPGALERFAPDLVFWIAGSDPHEHDLFGQMRLSDADMDARDKVVLAAIGKIRTPAVILFGGGYNRDRVHTARLHANTVKLAERHWAAERLGAPN
jgi:acetoin utilization deacetylase AcuC-like enzyme